MFQHKFQFGPSKEEWLRTEIWRVWRSVQEPFRSELLTVKTPFRSLLSSILKAYGYKSNQSLKKYSPKMQSFFCRNRDAVRAVLNEPPSHERLERTASGSPKKRGGRKKKSNSESEEDLGVLGVSGSNIGEKSSDGEEEPFVEEESGSQEPIDISSESEAEVAPKKNESSEDLFDSLTGKKDDSEDDGSDFDIEKVKSKKKNFSSDESDYNPAPKAAARTGRAKKHKYTLHDSADGSDSN